MNEVNFTNCYQTFWTSSELENFWKASSLLRSKIINVSIFSGTYDKMYSCRKSCGEGFLTK